MEVTMRYLLLLANAPDAGDDPTPDHDDVAFADWVAYTRALHEAGVLVAGEALHDSSKATTVRVRSGERVLTDGPFAETKEHLIGYYVIDVADLDAALGWAARVPNVRTGSVEVRPLQPGTSPEEMLGAAAQVGTGSGAN